MRVSLPESQNLLPRLRLLIVIVGLSLTLCPLWSQAQEEADPNQPTEPNAPAQPERAPRPAAGKPAVPSVWDLTVQGGIFMIPIGLTSIVVVAFSIERFLGLRGKKILPPKLLVAIQQLNSENGIDPRQAYQVTQEHPSPLANVIRVAILKIGRPHSELEQAVEDAVAREASEMAHNIRPINVSASVAPLLGLLGTVQGMIMAFMVTSTTTSTGTVKAQELAQGIYTALVTTFAGLCVAIPAVLLAHSLEGRIERLLRDMEDIFLEILPQFERFEGKLRIRRTVDEADKSGVLVKGTSSKSAAAPTVAPSKPVTPVKPATVSKPAAAPSVDDKEARNPKSKSLWSVMGARGESSDET